MVIENPHRVPEVLLSQIELVERDEAARIEEHSDREYDSEIDKRIDHELNLLPVISQASIPSDFESNDTPSLSFSNAISSKGVKVDLDNELSENPATEARYNYYASFRLTD